jgi:S-adenosylmethionine-diacylglycerol 3-amino-3-carboxypropyl transferase
MTASIRSRADFSEIRYAQVWEDADVLLESLRIQPGDRCLSIASAGDNALAMLTADPSEIVAVDISEAQLACLGLRIAAYRSLSHSELLGLMGSRPHDDRWGLYQRCRADNSMTDAQINFWDTRRALIECGIGEAGKFERYFKLFRRCILPLVHPRRRVLRLLEQKTADDRHRFYEQEWDTLRWRLMFRVFFSRLVMGRFGRDPEFFRYVNGDVGTRILTRARHAMSVLDPSKNPYMHWILTGTHGEALPLALREEHFETIRSRLDRITVVHGDLGSGLRSAPNRAFDRFNLSDIFEYMSETETESLLGDILERSSPGARLVYWNMLAERSHPESLADRIRGQNDEADQQLLRDKAFFYSRLVIEEVLG